MQPGLDGLMGCAVDYKLRTRQRASRVRFSDEGSQAVEEGISSAERRAAINLYSASSQSKDGPGGSKQSVNGKRRKCTDAQSSRAPRETTGHSIAVRQLVLHLYARCGEHSPRRSTRPLRPLLSSRCAALRLIGLRCV
eukprot:6184386-Pleurochrysis_carterae.AAC.1